MGNSSQGTLNLDVRGSEDEYDWDATYDYPSLTNHSIFNPVFYNTSTAKRVYYEEEKLSNVAQIAEHSSSVPRPRNENWWWSTPDLFVPKPGQSTGGRVERQPELGSSSESKIHHSIQTKINLDVHEHRHRASSNRTEKCGDFPEHQVPQQKLGPISKRSTPSPSFLTSPYVGSNSSDVTEYYSLSSADLSLDLDDPKLTKSQHLDFPYVVPGTSDSELCENCHRVITKCCNELKSLRLSSRVQTDSALGISFMANDNGPNLEETFGVDLFQESLYRVTPMSDVVCRSQSGNESPVPSATRTIPKIDSEYDRTKEALQKLETYLQNDGYDAELGGLSESDFDGYEYMDEIVELVDRGTSPGSSPIASLCHTIILVTKNNSTSTTTLCEQMSYDLDLKNQVKSHDAGIQTERHDLSETCDHSPKKATPPSTTLLKPKIQTPSRIPRMQPKERHPSFITQGVKTQPTALRIEK